MTTRDLILLVKQAIFKETECKALESLAFGIVTGTPVNAVAASKVLTVAGVPTADGTVSVADKMVTIFIKTL